jgi:hypothetical protein
MHLLIFEDAYFFEDANIWLMTEFPNFPILKKKILIFLAPFGNKKSDANK